MSSVTKLSLGKKIAKHGNYSLHVVENENGNGNERKTPKKGFKLVPPKSMVRKSKVF